MAKSALRRRRGTKSGSSSFWKQHTFLSAILGGMLLVAIGLTGGIFIGTMAYSGGTPPTAAQVKSMLRGPKSFNKGNGIASTTENNAVLQGSIDTGNISSDPNAQHPPPASAGSDKLSIESTSPIVRKKNFLSYQPEIGTKGAFPYYPKGNKLVDERHDFTSFTAPGGYRFEEYRHGDSPYAYTKGESDELARSRRLHVKKAMQHAWKGYEQYAFGMDEVLPETMRGTNNWGGFGTTLVDSLDTLWLMGMKEEFKRARDWVATSLDHNRPHMVSVFETTIRSLGGLLSAYDWSGDEIFLDQAKDLGKRLFQAVERNELGLPYGQVNLATGDVRNIQWTGGSAITAEFGTIQLEFRALARLSGNRDYKEKIEKIFTILEEMNPPNGLYPSFIKNVGVAKPVFANHKITFGAMGDSLYEYMLKVWLQGGKMEDQFRQMYDKSIQGMFDELLQLSSPTGLVFIADKNDGRLDTKMDHLVCFMGGLLALGAYTDPNGLNSDRAQRDLKTAKALTYTCYQMYARMPTGIAPEFVQFNEGEDFESGRGAPHYLLRPETVESFFVLYHLTGDPVYREWGWEVFQALERYCKTVAGYGSLHDVRKVSGQPDNKMESFFLAETLKYLYLLFDPDTPIDLLNKHVFNTEAHPIRTFTQMDAQGVKDLLK